MPVLWAGYRRPLLPDFLYNQTFKLSLRHSQPGADRSPDPHVLMSSFETGPAGVFGPLIISVLFESLSGWMYRQIIVRVCWLMSVLGSSHICQPLEDPVESSKLTLDDKFRLSSPMMKTLTRPPPWVRGVGCDVRSCPWCGRGLTGGATSSQQQSAASPRHCSIEIFPLASEVSVTLG